MTVRGGNTGFRQFFALMRIHSMPESMNHARIAITVGPLQYWWSRATLLDFYEHIADSPADTVVLGEIVCSRRNEMKHSDWLALGRDLSRAGKEVVLASQALIMSEGELRSVRVIAEQEEFAVEAGDASALEAIAQVRQGQGKGLPFVLGPHINVYNREALTEHAEMGACRWVAPPELPLSSIAKVNPVDDRVRGVAGEVATEVWAFGRIPLSFSARCFTARHHRLTKDACEFRCRNDADGLLLNSSEGEPFLSLNGTQIQSAGMQALIGEANSLRQAGVSRVRLSPCSERFTDVLSCFDTVYNHGGSAIDALARLRTLPLPGTLVNGYIYRHPGMHFVEPGGEVYDA